MRKLFFGLMALVVFVPFITYGQMTKAEIILKEYEEAMQAYDNGKTEEAFRIFKKLAEMGEPMSQVRLGMGYINGDSLLKDDHQAYQWFVKAAQTGYPEALFAKGTMLVIGQGGPKDLNQGMAHIAAAASAGYNHAQHTLCYFYDFYVYEIENAYFWCLVHQRYAYPENPSTDVSDSIKYFEGRLTVSKIKEIQAKAAAFQPIEWQYPAHLFDQ